MSKLKFLKKIMMLGTLGLSVQLLNAVQAAAQLRPTNGGVITMNKCGDCDCGDNGCCSACGACACAPPGGSASCSC
jgi:hypothetical protein